MNNHTWRDFAEQMTDHMRAIFERAENRGDSAVELRRLAESMLEEMHDQSQFQQLCDGVAVTPRIELVSTSGWLPPDDRQEQTYREAVVEAHKVGKVSVDAAAEIDLDGEILASFVYLTADLVSLTAEQARQVADHLRSAADRIESL